MTTTYTFEKLLTDPSVKKALQAAHLDEPTPVQSRSIPIIQDKKDLICQSSTGSGKTLAFAIPLIERIQPAKGLQVLVLVPTRELCEQVTEEFRKIAKFKSLNILEVYGGVSIDNQIRKVPQAHVVVATPGRLCDLLNRRAIKLDTVQTAVLDEADRMLDMGFVKDVEFILKATQQKRQTLMFSATLPPQMKKIIQRYMRNPEHIKTKEQVDKHLLKQYFYDVPIRDRFHLLVHLLKHEQAPYAIVFCGTRRAVDLITRNLNNNGIEAKAIHGGLTQAMRKQVMNSFHGKKTHILVASDIAARGLDIKLLTHVYNFDVPKTAEDYTHRIGRTARAGEEGVAITLVSDKDYDNFRRVQRDYRVPIEKKSLPEFERARFTPAPSYGRGGPRGRPQGGRPSGGRQHGRSYAPRQRTNKPRFQRRR